MGKLTNLNPPAPIAETDLPASIARDAEYVAADKLHVDAIDPHLQYPTQARGDARYLRADVSPPVYGSLIVPGSKGAYAGVHFPAALNAPTFMINTQAWQHGMYTSSGWQWQYNNGWLRVFNPITPGVGQTARGVYVGLEKSFGSLPGFPNDDFPCLKTDFTTFYISVGNMYSAHITSAGTYVAVSDKNRKKQAVEVDYLDCLNKIKNLSIYQYSFTEESDKIRRCGPYAQDFYEAFKLGGELEDNSRSPDKMLAPSDAIGIALAAVKGLALEVDLLKKSLKK